MLEVERAKRVVKKRLILLLFISVIFSLFVVYAQDLSKEIVYNDSTDSTPNEEVEVYTLPLTATESFIASSSKKYIALCDCSVITDTIKVTNNGDVTSHYVIKKSGTGADFASYTPISFVVEPSQTQEIKTFISAPCDIEGEFDLVTYFETLFGLKKKLSQQIKVNKCKAFNAYTAHNSYKNLPCTPTIYKIKINNQRNFIETFDISMDIPADYYALSEKSVLIPPGKEKEIYAYVKLPCDYSSAYHFNIFIKARQSSGKKSMPLYLEIDKSGYNFFTEINPPIQLVVNKTKTYAFTPTAERNFEFCENTVQMFPVRITNPAHFSNTYKISGEGFKFSGNEVTINPKNKQIINAFFYTKDKEGNHSYKIKVTSKGGLETTIPLKINVKDCIKKPSIYIPKKAVIVFIILILMLVALLVFFLMIAFMPRKKGLYEELEEYTLEEKKDEKEEIKEIEEEKEKIKEEKEKIKEEKERKVKEKKEAKKEIKELEELAKKPQRPLWWIWIFAVFVIAVLLGCFVFYHFNYKEKILDKASLFYDYAKNEYYACKDWFKDKLNLLEDKVDKVLEEQQKETENEKTAETTMINETGLKTGLEEKDKIIVEEKKQQEVVYDPTAYMTQKEIDFMYRTWDEDTTLVIDLNEVFLDKENDKLSFSNTPVPYIDVEYEDGRAYLTPHKDWNGNGTVVFIASDGKGGTASTPEIMLKVEEMPEWLQWTKEHLWYVIAAGCLVILLAIILISYGISRRKPKRLILKRKK